MSLSNQTRPTPAEAPVDRFVAKMRRTASYWPMALIGLSAAATLFWMGILVLLIRAAWEAI
jgi:hypothetical protein